MWPLKQLSRLISSNWTIQLNNQDQNCHVCLVLKKNVRTSFACGHCCHHNSAIITAALVIKDIVTTDLFTATIVAYVIETDSILLR